MFLRKEISPVALRFVIWFSNVKKMVHFWSTSSLETRNGLSTTMLNTRDCGVKKMNRFKAFCKSIFIKKRWCYLYGGILKESCSTINSEVHSHQLDKLKDSLKQKRSELINRKGVVFHHSSLVTRQKLLQLGWDILPYRPYSPIWHLLIIICFGLHIFLRR
jgi:hypothetical protein